MIPVACAVATAFPQVRVIATATSSIVRERAVVARPRTVLERAAEARRMTRVVCAAARVFSQARVIVTATFSTVPGSAVVEQ